MAKSKVYDKRSSGEVEFNMTPMIDCAFQLIIFFVLTATVFSDALADLVLHRPFESQAGKSRDLNELPNRIIVNVISSAEDKTDEDSPQSALAREYMVNGEYIEIGDRDRLKQLIKEGAVKAREQDFKEFYVEVRADHRVGFGAVQEVLKAAGGAAVPKIETKMNITALTYIRR